MFKNNLIAIVFSLVFIAACGGGGGGGSPTPSEPSPTASLSASSSDTYGRRRTPTQPQPHVTNRIRIDLVGHVGQAAPNTTDRPDRRSSRFKTRA